MMCTVTFKRQPTFILIFMTLAVLVLGVTRECDDSDDDDDHAGGGGVTARR